jgi:DNA (cytosine-5)-methyltransferase 1
MGGDTLGMKLAGIDVVAYCEINPTFQKTHQMNFPESILLGSDIRQVSDEQFEKIRNDCGGCIDMIFAGFPCQGFSNAGKKRTDDPRNELFYEFVRATRIIRPKIIMGENVKGLLSRKDKNYVDVIQKEFESLGYSLIFNFFKCHHYHIPQKRERLIFVGIDKNFIDQYNFSFPPENSDHVPNLRDIVHFDMRNTYAIDPSMFDFSSISDECIIRDMSNDEFASNPHPYLVSKASCDESRRTYQGKSYASLISFGKRDSPIHVEIVDIRKPSKTIICTYDHQPRLFVPVQNMRGNFLRTFTIDELKQIQGFPRNYMIAGSEKEQIIQIGNAVPPILIHQIISHIIHKKK